MLCFDLPQLTCMVLAKHSGCYSGFAAGKEASPLSSPVGCLFPGRLRVNDCSFGLVCEGTIATTRMQQERAVHAGRASQSSTCTISTTAVCCLTNEPRPATQAWSAAYSACIPPLQCLGLAWQRCAMQHICLIAQCVCFVEVM